MWILCIFFPTRHTMLRYRQTLQQMRNIFSKCFIIKRCIACKKVWKFSKVKNPFNFGLCDSEKFLWRFKKNSLIFPLTLWSKPFCHFLIYFKMHSEDLNIFLINIWLKYSHVLRQYVAVKLDDCLMLLCIVVKIQD